MASASQTEDQPLLRSVLSTPTSDQLDDWCDYIRYLVANYGSGAADVALADLEGRMMGSGWVSAETTGRKDSGVDPLELGEVEAGGGQSGGKGEEKGKAREERSGSRGRGDMFFSWGGSLEGVLMWWVEL